MRTLSEPDRTNPLTVGLIPARWHSTRFEGKPLALIKGVPMIQRVYDRARMCKNLDTIVVLTDDGRIRQYCAVNEIRCIEMYTGCIRCILYSNCIVCRQCDAGRWACTGHFIQF